LSVVYSNFRQLSAYQRSAELGDELRPLIAHWPRIDSDLGRQLLRCVDSIGANIAEAAGRWSHADRTRFLRMARGSLYEAEHWMARAHARGLVDEEMAERLTGIARPLSGLIKKPAAS
jgi:four helix bundle protein